MAITVEDAITKLTTGYWNKFARTEANPGGFGANGHVENLPALAEALGVVGDFVGTQGALADQVLTIQAEITAVANNAANIEAVADNLAAVLAAAANMAAIIAAPDAAAAAVAGAAASEGFRDEAEGFRDQAAASAAGVNLPALSAGQQSKVLRPKSDGTGYELQNTNAGAGTVVALDGGGKLPPVDGSQLTGIESPGAGGSTASGSVVLTSESPAVQAVTTTSYGQSVTLPDATTLTKGVPHYAISNRGDFDLAIKDAAGTIRGFLAAGESTVAALADNATAAGVWALPGTRLLGVSAALDVSGVDYGGGTFLQSVALDAARTLLIVGTTNIYAMVLDEEAGTLGTPVLVQAGGSPSRSLLVDTDKVLIVYGVSNSITARVLTIDGSSVTVGTADSEAAGGSIALGQLIACDGAYVLSYGRSGSAACLIAMTASGTTVTLGAKVDVLAGTSNNPNVYYAGTDKVLVVASTASTIRAVPYTLSGSSLSAGTETDWSCSAEAIRSLPLGTGRWAVFYNSTSTAFSGRIVSVSGTTATSSNALLTNVGGITNLHQLDVAAVAADKVLLVAGSSLTVSCSILTDNAGVAAAGTELTFASTDSVAGNGIAIVAVDGSVATVAQGAVSRMIIRRIDGSTGSPVYVDGAAVSAPDNFVSSAQSLPNGDLRPRVLRAGGVAALTTTANLGYPALVRGGQIAFAPPLPVINTLSYWGRNDSEAWAIVTSGTHRPGTIQRVTLAQP